MVRPFSGGGQATCAVLVAEWVVGDHGRRIRVGDTWGCVVRPPDGNEATFVNLALNGRVVPDQSVLPVFVWHADDPEPPIEIVGRVVSIRALRWDNQPGRSLSLRSLRMVTDVETDVNVDDYLIEVAGTIRPHV